MTRPAHATQAPGTAMPRVPAVRADHQESPSASQLLGAWEPDGRGGSHHQLGLLLAALDPSHSHDADTLGERNRRLLELHRALMGSPLEARVTCGPCGVDSEFRVPAEGIMGLPAAGPDARVTTRHGRRRFTFRVPRMADVETAGRGGNALTTDDVRRTVLERCRVGGDGGEIPEPVARRLAARFESLDPAANIVVNIRCSGCGHPLTVSIDVAAFVARALDRLIEGLLRDVDTIATAYSWDEERILGLPAWRRRRYIELIATARVPSRPALAAAPR